MELVINSGTMNSTFLRYIHSGCAIRKEIQNDRFRDAVDIDYKTFAQLPVKVVEPRSQQSRANT